MLARVAKDPAFEPDALGLRFGMPQVGEESNVDRIGRIAGEQLLAYTAEWWKGLESSAITPELLSEKFEELAWMNTIIYAVGGWAVRKQCQDERGAFSADFFL